MTQGSRVVISAASVRRQLPVRAAARLRAAISACATGSINCSVRLNPSPSSSPWRTTTAPIGTSPSRPARRARSRATSIHRDHSESSKDISLEATLDPLRGPRRVHRTAAKAAEAGGAPRRARTSNLRLRRPTLYPVELWAHRRKPVARARVGAHERAGTIGALALRVNFRRGFACSTDRCQVRPSQKPLKSCGAPPMGRNRSSRSARRTNQRETLGWRSARKLRRSRR